VNKLQIYSHANTLRLLVYRKVLATHATRARRQFISAPDDGLAVNECKMIKRHVLLQPIFGNG